MHWAFQLNSRVRQHARNEPVNLGRSLNLQECPINAEIWLPRLFTMQARAIAPVPRRKPSLPPEIRGEEENGFLMILEDRSA